MPINRILPDPEWRSLSSDTVRDIAEQEYKARADANLHIKDARSRRYYETESVQAEADGIIEEYEKNAGAWLRDQKSMAIAAFEGAIHTSEGSGALGEVKRFDINPNLTDSRYTEREFPRNSPGHDPDLRALAVTNNWDFEVWTNEQDRTIKEVREAIYADGLIPAGIVEMMHFAYEQPEDTTILIPQLSTSVNKLNQQKIPYMVARGVNHRLDLMPWRVGNQDFDGQFLVVRPGWELDI
jgi:hypothetical protein